MSKDDDVRQVVAELNATMDDLEAVVAALKAELAGEPEGTGV